MERTKGYFNTTSRQVKGESNSFQTFNDEQLSSHLKQQSKLTKANRKIIKSLNIFNISDIKQEASPTQKSHPLRENDSAKKVPRQYTLSSESIDLEGTNDNSCSQGKEPRYTKSNNSDIKIELGCFQESNLDCDNSQRIRVLKKILEQYHNKVMEPYFKSNLINKCHNHFNSSTNATQPDLINKCHNHFNSNTNATQPDKKRIPFKKPSPKEPAKRSITSSHMNKRERGRPKNNSIKSADIFQNYFNHNRILVEAQGINEYIKNNQIKKKTTVVREKTTKQPQKQIKISHPPTVQQRKIKAKYETLPNEKVKALEVHQDNCINIKVNKYKEFLFVINLAHKIYRELDIPKYQQPFKVHIGRGNNRNLIRAIMKRRFWFQTTKDITQAHFVWTQLKEESIYQKQIKLFQSRRQNITTRHQTQRGRIHRIPQIEDFDSELAQTKNSAHQEFNLEEHALTRTNIALRPPIRSKTKTKKFKDTTLQVCEPLSRLLSEDQVNRQREIWSQAQNKRRRVFGERLAYLGNVTVGERGEMSRQVVHNHLPANGLLGNKKAMFYMLREYYQLHSKDIFSVVPLTYHIRKAFADQQFKQFATKFIQNRIAGYPNYWILKPGQFSNRGQGISCTNKLDEIKGRLGRMKGTKNKSLIIQQYITNPLLYHGRKFDIRTYMLVSTNNCHLRAYWYQEGYVRTSSYLWSLEDIEDNEIHLTNDAIQKYSINYGKYEPANKITYTELQRYLDTLPRNGTARHVNFHKQVYPQLKQIATDAIKATYCFIDPHKKGNNFEIFGFDFMLDSHFHPWLIEINTNPCLEMNCPVLDRIIPGMVENAFRIALDPLFPPPLNYSSNYKYSIPENALHYNRFQVIFDQERDGPPLEELYRQSNVLKEMDEYEEDKEIYEEEGEEIDLEDT